MKNAVTLFFYIRTFFEFGEISAIMMAIYSKNTEKDMDEKITFTITGDIGFDKYMSDAWKRGDLIDEDVLDFLRSSDHLIVNVEGPLYDAGTCNTGSGSASGAASLIHSMNPGVGDFLDRIGADIWNVNNNHIMDAGPEGLKATLENARSHNAVTIGAGANIDEASKPLKFDAAGGIGIVSVGYERACRKAGPDTPGCLNFSDIDIVTDRIKEVKKTCRYCVVIAHDGEEFTALPSPYTRERFHKYLESGADIVVAHHPHVPMNYETVGEKIIFYSLGNFIFDTDYQRSQFNTDSGILLKFSFDNEGFKFEPFFIRIDREKERVVKGERPLIFENVDAAEYELLSPLAAAMFVENTKKQLRYLNPDVFENASDEDYMKNFYEPLRSGRVPGKLLDFQIVVPLSEKAREAHWKRSRLEGVKKYMLAQMPSRA